MKNIMKRTLAVILAMTMLAVLVPHTAGAAEKIKYYRFNITTLSQDVKQTTGAFVTKKDGSDWVATYNAFKISVPKDGYVLITTNNTEPIYISNNIKKDKTYTVDQWTSGKLFKYCLKDSKTYKKVLPKGNYYLYTSSNAGKLTIKYTFKSVANPTNYDRSAAKKLAKDTKTTIVFNRGHEYSRWFKIKPTSTGKKTITLKQLDPGTIPSVSEYFSVFDSNGNKITCSSKGVTSKKLTKDKWYYVRVDYPYFWDAPWTDNARIWQLSWK